MVTDRVADLLLCTSEDAVRNLAGEGIASEGVELVGNTMIDSLFRLLEGVDRSALLAKHDVESGNFVLVTLHRPALVDDPELLGETMEVLAGLAESIPVLFPVHPRTRARLEAAGVPGLGRGAAAGAARLRRVHRPRSRGAAGDHRLRRGPGGDLGARACPASPTGRAPSGRSRSSSARTGWWGSIRPSSARAAEEALATDPPAEPPEIPLWDGNAGPRSAEAITAFLGAKSGAHFGLAAGVRPWAGRKRGR